MRGISSLVQAGIIVLTDRYVYTAYARDIVRGCDPRWARDVYDFAIKPNLAFYFRVPIDVASERILAGRPTLRYYEAGMDLNLSNDLYEIYRIFHSRIIDQYESMIQSERFLPIDGTSGIEEQQQLVRKKIAEIIPQGKGPIRIVKKQVLKDA
jgi:dTMP kinase